MKEIVAAKIGTLITNSPSKIGFAVENDAHVEFLDRRRMALMAAMDLGDQWKKLATGSTLFCIDDNGEPVGSVTETPSQT